MKHNKEDLEQLEKELNEIELLKEKAIKANTLQEIREVFNEISQKVEIKKMAKKEDNSSIKVKDINQEIEEADKRLKNYIDEYDRLYDKMKQIVKKQDEKMETPILLTEEELGDIRIESIKEQYQENEKSISIKKSIDEEKGIIQSLKKKKQQIEEKNNKENSVLDNIDAIYVDKSKYNEINEPEEILVSEIKMNSIKDNIEEVPEKIVNSSNGNDITPGEAPEDMNGTTINSEEEIIEKKPLERITIYQDTKTDEYFVTDAVIKRFTLIPSSDEVLIEEQACYQVNNEDIEDIIKNSDNDSNEYEVYLVDIELEEDLNQEIEDAIVEVDAILNNDDAFTVIEIKDDEAEKESKQEKKTAIYKSIIKDLDRTNSKKESFKPINLQASNEFQNELKNGDWEYDVAYSIPEIGKADNKFFINVSKSLMNTAKAHKRIDLVTTRLNELNDEEIEDLKLEYNALNDKDNIIPNIRELIEEKI